LRDWVTGVAKFLGGNSIYMAIILITVFVFGLLYKRLSGSKKGFGELSLFTKVLIGVSLLVTLLMSSFEPHYPLPVWILMLVLLPWLMFEIFNRFWAQGLLSLLILFNLFVSLSKMQMNHGYYMPNGWSLEKINRVAKIVSADSGSHQNFNVASMLDGDTRTYPLRYVLKVSKTPPAGVADYPSNDHLYLMVQTNRDIGKINVWEVSSMKPFVVGKAWDIKDGVSLVRLDRDK